MALVPSITAVGLSNYSYGVLMERKPAFYTLSFLLSSDVTAAARQDKQATSARLLLYLKLSTLALWHTIELDGWVWCDMEAKRLNGGLVQAEGNLQNAHRQQCG